MAKSYKQQLVEAFENPPQGGNGRSGILIPSQMIPMPPDRNYVDGGRARMSGSGISLKDEAIANVIREKVGDLPGNASPEQRMDHYRRSDEVRRDIETRLSAPTDGREATAAQAFYAGQEGALANTQTSAVGDGRYGSNTGVPDMRNHLRNPVDAAAGDPLFNDRSAYYRSAMLEGDGIVRGEKTAEPGDMPTPTLDPPTPGVRADGKLSAPSNDPGFAARTRRE